MRIAPLCLAAMATVATALPARADVFGYWLNQDQDAIIEITPCGNSACGSLVWFAEPNFENGQPKTDLNNPDPAMTTRTVCNLQIIGDFTNDGDSKWTDGSIYDPKKGKTYKSKMHVTDEGNLYLRGYIGISLIGRSETWTRTDGNRTGC